MFMQAIREPDAAAGETRVWPQEIAPQRDWRRILARDLLRSPVVLFSILLLLLLVVVAVAAPWLAPLNPTRINVLTTLKPPFWMSGGSTKNLLGTDSLGRDILSQLIYGARVSLLVGFTVVIAGGTLGTVLGLVAGYYGGLVDDVIMRIADIQLAFPFILMAITFLAVLGPGLGNVILVLVFGSWMNYARVMRGQVLSLREKEFIEAAHAIGTRTRSILFRHLLPNALTPIIVIASFSVASTIIAEASLSFLGLGVRPSTPSWGAMLANGREHITDSWWLVVIPGFAIMLTVLAINILGDWLRDRLDPRLRV
jgi:peptide/nickel transport system permease protein